VIAPRYREDICLDAAAALEDRVGILTPMDPRSALIRMRSGELPIAAASKQAAADAIATARIAAV
jgi:hypothetical protein